MAESNIFRVVVSVEQPALKQIKQVVAALESAGLKVDQVMPVLGIVTGAVDAAKVAALKKVMGVAAVEKDEEMKAI